MSGSKVVQVKDEIAQSAHVSGFEAYEALYQRSVEDPEGFWAEQGQRLHWYAEPIDVMKANMDAVDFAWFSGGKLNAAYNCVHRHVKEHGQKDAIVWAGDEPGVYEHISFADLSRRVHQMANALRAHGVRKGDCVCIYLPMIPELAITMLACAQIGAMHSVVFAGFSAQALRERILDAECCLVVTANQGVRGGRRIALKETTDKAIDGLRSVNHVFVARPTDTDVEMHAGRDRWLHDVLANERSTAPCEWMDAEDPLFVLYTSGSTGRPKGVLHTTGGYLVYAAYSHEWVFDIHQNDVYFCAADCGWVTGHTYIVYGPLANACTTVMFESTPLYPDASRYWSVCEDLGVTVFYTAPTAIRAIAREGDEFVTRHDRSSIRVLGTVGEPINPEVWEWYHDVVGEGRAAIVDTWWQTETGGIMISPLPGATPTKPGSATFPLPGIQPVLVDGDGQRIEGNDVRGNLCIQQGWPGQARTIYGDHKRFVDTYYAMFPGHYFTGDGCWRDQDGYYWITGRVDDVLNVSGHRLGTAEIESALVAHPAVAEAAVVGYPHEIKGTGIYVYAVVNVLAVGAKDEALVKALKTRVREGIGPVATPDIIQIVPGLPKTRSGKIMRRILRKIAASEYDQLGDVSTLADPEVVNEIIKGHKV